MVVNPRVIFLTVATYVVAAFVWWTYVLVSNNIQAERAEQQMLYMKATRLSREMELARSNGKQVRNLTELKFREFHVDPTQYTITPKGNVLPSNTALIQIQQIHKRKFLMYLLEGVVFIGLLIWGITYIFNNITARLDLNRQKNNFLLSVTHELKSPMAAVKLNLQTIKKRDLDRAQTTQIVDNALEEIDRLNELVENVLMATRMEGEHYEFSFDPFNISEMVKETGNRFLGTIGKGRLEMKVEDGLQINGDRFSLAWVLTNLLENAFKYSPKGSPVQLILTRDQEGVVMQVADQGYGIPREERENIFNKFYRLGNEETRQSKGTGLGLYIVREVLKKHHFGVKVKDNTPRGTVFEVLFRNPEN